VAGAYSLRLSRWSIFYNAFLERKRTTKGVFITTSDFHKNALDYAKGVTHKIILINGQRLAELMIEYGVGVSTVRTIALKRVDSDYFEDA
jgi:restriction system protein